MKIRKNSWHYKLINWYVNIYDMPKSICTYFWTLIGSCIFTILLPFFAIFTIVTLTLPFWWLFLEAPGWDVLAALVGIVDILILLTILRESRDYRDAEPTIISTYLKAKKEKVCPLVTYE